MNTIKQALKPTDAVVILEQLKQALAANDHHKVRSLKKLAAHSPILTDAQKAIIEGQIALESGCYPCKKTRAECRSFWWRDGHSHGNSGAIRYQAQRELDLALRCLGNSAFMSPLNVDHLCNIAECHLEKGDENSYNETIEKAKSIDDNERVREVEAKAALQQGHLETARKLLERLNSFKEVLAYTNNRAVTYIRNGDFDEGLKLYHQALKALPESKRELHALIRYNIGLAYARQNDLDAALAELKKGENCKNPTRRKKIKNLKSKIVQSIEKGSPLVLSTNAPPTEADEAEKLRMFSQLEKDTSRKRSISRADYCCFKLYKTHLGNDVVENFERKKPSFNFRGKIIKDFKGIRQDSA